MPIYYGDKDITHIFNPDSFVNCHDYKNLDLAVERVKEIEENPDLWKKYVETPCFNDPQYVAEKNLEFDIFLRNIFDQDYEKAFRRPLKFRPVWQANMIKAYMRIRDIIRTKFLARNVLKLFGISLDY